MPIRVTPVESEANILNPPATASTDIGLWFCPLSLPQAQIGVLNAIGDGIVADPDSTFTPWLLPEGAPRTGTAI